jgi:hypothetical protein
MSAVRTSTACRVRGLLTSLLVLAMVLVLGDLGTAWAASGTASSRSLVGSSSVVPLTVDPSPSDSPSPSPSPSPSSSPSPSPSSSPDPGSCESAPAGSTCVYLAGTDPDLLAVVGLGLTILVLVSTAQLVATMRRR